MKITLFFFILFGFCQLTGQQWSSDDIQTFNKYDDIEYIFEQQSDTTYLINFWATWCKPCVAELPYIEEVAKSMRGKKYKSVLVSLDFERQLDSKLVPFLNKHEIVSDVLLLTDGKASKWIDRVDPDWSGAIPITIVYNGEKRSFFERQFHDTNELLEIVNSFLTE